ncbi:MsnO8 family LLM class oxidoreductase [Pseudonocardia sp. KRD291]|uniref:MsnO8 family LLM class oxidoreductase n=1 Tax=Pseudonocardia sp. KRD291 TaxID=2792007 RepID=UPI001CF7B13F|nr:MsnO8 family LLM class oxidoreductase [Pseudonocardia sp. KRD291]
MLDRSRTRSGEPDSAALHHTLERARRAERLGYHRFWVAEHHAVPGIASGSPPVLMAAVAGATERVRVGSGGIMLPNHQPLVVAEQLAMLSALYPGRIDAGIGRTPGFTEPVRRALRSGGADDARFGADLDELRGYLDGTAAVTVRPRIDRSVPLYLLATGAGLAVAGDRGLPVVVGGPVLDDRAALQDYRNRAGPDAHLVVSADVLIGDPDLALSEAWALAAARTTGEFPPLEPPDPHRRMTERQRRDLDRALSRTIAGDEDTVAERLDALVERTGADELLVTSSTWDVDALAESDARLAAVLSGITGHVPA